MNDIAIVKKRSLIVEHLIKILEGQVVSQVDLYDPKEHYKFYEMNKLPYATLIDITYTEHEKLINLVKFLKERRRKVIVLISRKINCDHLKQLFHYGLDGYFFSEMENEEITLAMETIFRNERYIHPHLSSVLLKDYLRLINKKVERPSGLLTKREWEVLELIVSGQTTYSIGDSLDISTKTVTNHIASILRKLDVQDRTNAALIAVKNRWITL